MRMNVTTAPRTESELRAFVKKYEPELGKYSVAVEALIINEDGNLLLVRRGKNARDEQGKLECIGGAVEDPDALLREELEREIREEIGDDAEVEICSMIDIKSGTVGKGRTWLVASFACILRGGTPVNAEPWKHDEILWADGTVDVEQLSESCKKAISVLRGIRESALNGRLAFLVTGGGNA